MARSGAPPERYGFQKGNWRYSRIVFRAAPASVNARCHISSPQFPIWEATGPQKTTATARRIHGTGHQVPLPATPPRASPDGLAFTVTAPSSRRRRFARPA